MRNLKPYSLLLGFLLLQSSFAQEVCTCSNSLEVGTWNTNLIPASTLYRLERSQEALRIIRTNTTLDVLCLQEVFSMTDQTAWVIGLNETFPYSYTAPRASQNCSMACSAENKSSLDACASSCTNLAGEEGTNCLYVNCGAELGNLPAECQMCLGITATGTFGETLAGCTANETLATEGCEYLYGGSSGNLILSKYPFTATRYLTFNSTAGIASGALHVRFDYNGSPVNFFCTSLSPSISPYASGTNMSEINRMQTTELLDWIQSGVQNNEPVIVAGSFNQSPESGAGSGVDSDNYNLWISAGYESALAVISEGQLPCTLCSTDNSQGSQNTTGVMVDHIFVKISSTPSPCVESASLFASRATIETSSGVVAVSTHSGVSASVCYQNQTSPTVSPSTPPPTAVPTPTSSPSVAPSPSASFTPIIVPVAPVQEASEGGIAGPAVVLAAVLVGVAMILNR